ncbi:hypothetical protein NVP2275O_235 [Vibrio phage 2.275.O._10N.286.54.E11]|nr:hypothetical protein NVP2275O_235 [Vibrio phage 2.275.O._10N.286.54.E11]
MTDEETLELLKFFIYKLKTGNLTTKININERLTFILGGGEIQVPSTDTAFDQSIIARWCRAYNTEIHRVEYKPHRCELHPVVKQKRTDWQQ